MPGKKNIDLKSFFGKFTKNISLLFFAAFIALIVFETLEVKNSIKFVIDVSQTPPVTKIDKGVRINFDNYNEVVKRIEGASTFMPTGGIGRDPFTASPVPPPQSPSPAPSSATSTLEGPLR